MIAILVLIISLFLGIYSSLDFRRLIITIFTVILTLWLSFLPFIVKEQDESYIARFIRYINVHQIWRIAFWVAVPLIAAGFLLLALLNLKPVTIIECNNDTMNGEIQLCWENPRNIDYVEISLEKNGEPIEITKEQVSCDDVIGKISGNIIHVRKDEQDKSKTSCTFSRLVPYEKYMFTLISHSLNKKSSDLKLMMRAKDDLPSPVSNASANCDYEKFMCHLEWENPNDVDLKYIQIELLTKNGRQGVWGKESLECNSNRIKIDDHGFMKFYSAGNKEVKCKVVLTPNSKRYCFWLTTFDNRGKPSPPKPAEENGCRE